MRHSVLFATAFATLISTQTFAADLPGKGITVNPVQSTITEETFQTLLVSRALEKLGYTVNKPSEVDYNVGYTSLASGDATFTAVNWTPLHDNMYEAAGGDKKFYREGVFVNGAAQGYLIDKKTADQYKITNIAQLKDPKIAKLFDTNGDGKADLTGCNPGWGCEGAINHQLAAYGLTNTVTHNQGFFNASTRPLCKWRVRVIAMPDASRIQPVRTASENQIKWLIELSRAVKRTSPMVSPL